jgi:uncharacterized protein (DUF1501 family)
MKRGRFLLGALSGMTVVANLDHVFGRALAASPLPQLPGGEDRVLVLVNLQGGNDGLNCVVPHGNPLYYQARPSLAIRQSDVLQIDANVGFNPQMRSLKNMYDKGMVAVVQSVGYPNPDHSHFRSTEIWQTASDANIVESYGWLGRYFDSCCKGADPTVGVAIGNQIPQSFASLDPTGVSFSRPEQYRWINGDHSGSSESVYREMNEPIMDPATLDENDGGSVDSLPGATAVNRHESTLEFLQRTALDAQMSSDKVLAIAKKYPASVSYPHTALGDSLSLVGRMIAGGLATRVFYVSQGGYDTHINQVATHARLMGELNDALVAFSQDLTAQGNFGRVMLMTFSEFGRRVNQNASNGTDHGAAAPMFAMGGGIKAGLHGQYPSLEALNEGDLAYNVDFRSVYATILDRWLRAPSKEVLGRQFPLMNLV